MISNAPLEYAVSVMSNFWCSFHCAFFARRNCGRPLLILPHVTISCARPPEADVLKHGGAVVKRTEHHCAAVINLDIVLRLRLLVIW